MANLEDDLFSQFENDDEDWVEPEEDEDEDYEDTDDIPL